MSTINSDISLFTVYKICPAIINDTNMKGISSADITLILFDIDDAIIFIKIPTKYEMVT